MGLQMVSRFIPGPTGHNAVHLHFTGCTIYTGADASGNLGHCCLIQPQPASGGGPGGTAVGQVVFTSCFFELGEEATIGIGGAGILVDATNGPIEYGSVSFHATRPDGPGRGFKLLVRQPALICCLLTLRS